MPANGRRDLIRRLKVKADLHMVEQQKTEFTPTTERRQIKLLLRALEDKLEELHQVLPCMDRRRWILNLGGTATVADVH